jgi:hypothetical protein
MTRIWPLKINLKIILKEPAYMVKKKIQHPNPTNIKKSDTHPWSTSMSREVLENRDAGYQCGCVYPSNTCIGVGIF